MPDLQGTAQQTANRECWLCMINAWRALPIHCQVHVAPHAISTLQKKCKQVSF